MIKLKSLSVFFPCLNDGESIPELLSKTYKILPKITADFEVIIVDDGSTDNTPQILERLLRKYKNLRVIRNNKPSGYGGVLRRGFESSKKDWIFYTDGDGQYDPAELKKLVEQLTPDIGVVNGYKTSRHDDLVRGSLGFIYNRILHLVYSIPIRDIDCDFRLIRTSMLKKIKLHSNSGAVCLELVMKLKNQGAKFAEIPVRHYKRKHGKSAFFKLSSLTQTLIENIKIFKEVKTNL